MSLDAVSAGADMLLTHHPLIFGSIRKINSEDFIGRRLIDLISNDISYYAMHTNFDVLGMAYINEKQLELQDTHVLDVTRESDGVVEGIGRVGFLPEPMSLISVADYVREHMHLEAVRCFDLHDKILQISCPVYVIGAGDDRVLGTRAAQDLIDALNCPYYIYEGYGHGVYDEAPDYLSHIAALLTRSVS